MDKLEITTKDEAIQSLESIEAILRKVYEHPHSDAPYGREQLTAVLGTAFNEVRKLKQYVTIAVCICP